ncbi:hypothetical protein DN407_30960 (plasmid) [Bacillus sp. JAS24-2]|uniref:hypothetical protein n=1 Tax=Bacillus sp. JAS24-2 TaxID=2217832 RepID=UPI0011F07234|nr:hypothetical protein [Bacillus sp. JAS24-2]QEL82844.1 hypothetical protein DN407_30960 [Bacillus sp. JAS24-2]
METLLWTIGLVMLASQIYISVHLYKTEQSILWACIGFFLCFGLNVYIYQITKLEKYAGYSFEKLQQKERKKWQKVYVLILIQYIIYLLYLVGLTPHK